MVQKTIFRKYKHGKEWLCQYFRTFTSISLFVDTWIDAFHKTSIICITEHWIDDSWNIPKLVITSSVLNKVYTTDMIYRLIHGVIKEYGLTFKIFPISFDYASGNMTSVRPLE